MSQKFEDRIYDTKAVYYVYHLINPVTGLPFYVGKGTRYRCYQHFKDTFEQARNKRLHGHIRKLREKGIEPYVLKIQENMPEKYAYELEELEIKKYGRIGYEKGGILMNILLESRPPVRYGEDNGFYGRTHSEETKKIIGDSNRGRKHTKETREKMSKQRKGVPKSEEHKRKIGDKSRGRSPSEETREKLRAAALQEDALRKNIEAKQKEWIVITPEGEELEVVNLSDFCKERGLCRSKMYKVASGKASHHKHYKCRKKYPDS